MAIGAPFNLNKWIEDNRHLLKPPVGNQQVYLDNDDFIVMVVGGPNGRKDYHFNNTEELFYQVQGDITLKIIEDGVFKDIHIKEGEMFLLPGRVPHSPQRPADTVGLVIEKYREKGELDKMMWFCEDCKNKIHEATFEMVDIVNQLPIAMNEYKANHDARTCKECGSFMELD